MSSCCDVVFSIVSDEKSAVNLIGVPLYVRSHISLAAFKISSLSLAFSFLLGVALFEFILLDKLSFLDT